MRGGILIAVGVLTSAVAGAAKDGSPPDKVVEQFFRAWVGRKVAPLKRLLAKPEAAVGLFAVDESWFELPPFKKAWAGQQAQVGEVSGEGDAVTVQVNLLKLDVGPLAGIAAEVDQALSALPGPQREKRRKPQLIQALRLVEWRFEPRVLSVACSRQDGRWRIVATGLETMAQPAAPPEAPIPSPPPEEEEISSGGLRVNRADLAAYPAALKLLSVEGRELDSAFRGKVIASVRNQGRLAIRGVRATVVYEGGGKRTLDPNRSFVASTRFICPGAIGQLETEALPPADRGSVARVSLEEVVVELDRPDAFGRLLSQSCAGR